MNNLTKPELAASFKDINYKSDVFIIRFLYAHVAFSLFLATFYDTWLLAVAVGASTLITWYVIKLILPGAELHRYVASMFFGVYVGLFIYQMHGLFEMHFFAFIASAILITYQNWKLQVPLILFVGLHHAAFAYAQFIGSQQVYFTQLEYMDLQTFIFHISLAITVVTICGFWAHNLRLSTIANAMKAKELENSNSKLENSISEIQVTNAALDKEKKEVRYLYNQSEAVFNNVDEGIFLLNPDFTISDVYSKQMEQIFEQKEIANQEFINFMRPRLVTRDLEALQMYIKHLFDAEIETDVLSQLNPVEHIEIFHYDEQGIAHSKHIKILFSRVFEGESIRNILVTVIDETETVQLEMKVREAEQKNKQETEQMLSILRIEPDLLMDFLVTAEETLESISLRYEMDSKHDYNELINFTFNTVHNLKGNASLIDLQLLTEKFHDLENSLSKLKTKNVVGNDFLNILYEISEISILLSNIKSLLNRVINISTQFSQKQLNTDERLIEALERGAKRISADVGKKVKFQFANDKHISIPEKYKLDIKDISIQLIRNSIMHGIEFPEERTTFNKPEEALIQLSLDQSTKDGNLHFKYKDDGQGLDLKKILRQAIDKGMVSKEQAQNFEAKDILKLLFKDGFSTSESVTEHSGRGHGLSLVNSLTKKHKGKLNISFKKGQSFELDFIFPTNTQELAIVA
ncbi:Histidine kinase-, DNA gyrase B-, and HSP90-like ATPase [Reichenbachiella faecimaris]|uniref:Histidine kinase-, DNA gyrase B-, and HSP90-like ATPase n=1 Tax=Reichenbachiella faecimaris TaxID=692418 RepID=A0A1W2GP35_REIFA|nr:ATP-binding protein [Reichenbachiella faecimaris]SMD38344.1 Histidine kinase-, DNA gyrase B-, and HSP90-like ATPase [Reichenbachiella faecimaris]